MRSKANGVYREICIEQQTCNQTYGFANEKWYLLKIEADSLAWLSTDMTIVQIPVNESFITHTHKQIQLSNVWNI